MSAKNRDNKNRWRNITVGFRVSPEENERINKAVALSGLPKQEYCYRRCLNQDVVVQGNPRVYKALKLELAAVLTELKRIEAGNSVDEELMPTYHNPSGNKAYIMNMYTNPEYRRLGIAYKTLDMLIRDTKSKGITAISLEATDMGRPLYEKYGFVKMNDEMELPER